MKRFVLSFYILFFLTSCGLTPVDAKKDYTGYTESQLVSMWGVPTGTYKTNDGKLFLDFERSYDAGGNTYKCKRSFVLQNSKVVSWKLLGYC